MATKLAQLGALLKAHRDQKGVSQEKLAEMAGSGVNRTNVAQLEQGNRLPKPSLLEAICSAAEIPRIYWEPFTNSQTESRFKFEETLAELVGRELSLDLLDLQAQQTASERIDDLFSHAPSTTQARDIFNSILVFYGIPAVSTEFFDHYLPSQAFSSLASFQDAVEIYQKDAIRLFSTFREAFNTLTTIENLKQLRAPLMPVDVKPYTERTEWKKIQEIPDFRLPDLGYISAARVSKESGERRALQSFLEELASQVQRDGPQALLEVSEPKRRRMDSLLRKFQPSFPHGLFSPLFGPDADALRREASRVAPKTEEELATISETQAIALKNLSEYLSADFLDLYVATSMRTDADFVSVNHLVTNLFKHSEIRQFKLRYFNPTHSWIEDRISKGLVEALMLRRASFTIYMAQKEETFGKDSEASVSLGQGKPVIVYVPKLELEDVSFDTEDLSRKSRSELVILMKAQQGIETSDIDETFDEEALIARLLTGKIQSVPDETIADAVRRHWADFDLYSEARRIDGDENRGIYRKWLDGVIRAKVTAIPREIRSSVIDILVANATTFEKRARLFREIHPLALQVILNSGVLNGMLVVRSVQQCARVLSCLIRNELSLRLVKDDQNYRLIEKISGSTIRVISRHQLLQNAFELQRRRE